MPPVDALTYEELRHRQEAERRSPRLTQLTPDFYRNLELYLRGLLEEYRREHDKDPTSSRAVLLGDELGSTRQLAEDLYDKRERKVVWAAVVKARGGNPDLSHMLVGERELYEQLVVLLRGARQRVLHTHTSAAAKAAAAATAAAAAAASASGQPSGTAAPAAGASGGTPPQPGPAAHGAATSPPPAGPAPAPGAAGPAPAPGATAAPPPPAPDGGDATGDMAGLRTLVRAVEDVGEFLGSDLRTYHVAKEDLVSLPGEMARILILRGKAVEVTPVA